MSLNPNRCVLGQYITRPLGRKLVPLLGKTPITGNQVSMFSILLLFFSSILIGFEKTIIAAILLNVSQMLDSTDGTLARLKNQVSIRGLYLEAIWHEIALPSVFFALGIYSYKLLNNPIYIIFGSVSMICVLIINLLHHNHQLHYNIKPSTKPKTSYTLLEDIVILIAAPGYVFFYVLVLAIIGYLEYLIIPYFIFYSVLTIYKFVIYFFLNNFHNE